MTTFIMIIVYILFITLILFLYKTLPFEYYLLSMIILFIITFLMNPLINPTHLPMSINLSMFAALSIMLIFTFYDFLKKGQ